MHCILCLEVEYDDKEEKTVNNLSNALAKASVEMSKAGSSVRIYTLTMDRLKYLKRGPGKKERIES